MVDNNNSISRQNIIKLLDSFIEQMTKTQKTLLIGSLFGMTLAPATIIITVLLISSPSFIEIVDMGSRFEVILMVLVALVLVVSGVWIIIGFRQYRSIGSWNKRYGEYMKKGIEVENKVISEFGLDDDMQTTGTKEKVDDDNV